MLIPFTLFTNNKSWHVGYSKLIYHCMSATLVQVSSMNEPFRARVKPRFLASYSQFFWRRLWVASYSASCSKLAADSLSFYICFQTQHSIRSQIPTVATDGQTYYSIVLWPHMRSMHAQKVPLASVTYWRSAVSCAYKRGWDHKLSLINRYS